MVVVMSVVVAAARAMDVVGGRGGLDRNADGLAPRRVHGRRRLLAPMSMLMMVCMVVPVIMCVVMTMLTRRAVVMARLPMRRVRMVMTMIVGMTMAVTMTMSGRMGMPTRAVRATFGLEAAVLFAHRQVHGAQHVGQHVIGFNLQVVGLEFDLHMAVTQVVGRTHQVEGRAMRGAWRDDQHRLGRRHHADHGAVFGHQHVTAAHGGAAGQEDTQGAALAVGGVEAAFLTHIPVEFDGGSTLEQHRGQTLALREEFVDGQHLASVAQKKPAA
jgi:hypothetical protein